MNNPRPDVIDPWGDPTGTPGGGMNAGMNINANNNLNLDNTNNLILWRERERRQRTVRTLMMFLLMLLIMDGDENGNPNNHHARNRGRDGQLRRRRQKKNPSTISPLLKPLQQDVFESRQHQDETLRSLVQQHARYQALVDKNNGENVYEKVRTWAQDVDALEKDQFGEEQETTTQNGGAAAAASPQNTAELVVVDDDLETNHRKIFHYPWNATGFYRGQWKKRKSQKEKKKKNVVDESSQKSISTTTTTSTASPTANVTTLFEHEDPLPATQLEQPLLALLRQRQEIAGVYLLPDHQEILMRNDNNLTTLQWERMQLDAAGKVYPAVPVPVPEKKSGDDKKRSSSEPPSVTLTTDSGRAAFQLYSRTIPTMSELSIVDGFVKLYDSTSPTGYSTRKDVLLRVRGVLIHGLGRLSLVSSRDNGVSRSALVVMAASSSKSSKGSSIGGGGTTTTADTTTSTAARRRRLQEALSSLEDHAEGNKESEAEMDAIRRDAMALYADNPELFSQSSGFTLQSPELFHRRLSNENQKDEQMLLSLVRGESSTNIEQAGTTKEEETDSNVQQRTTDTKPQNESAQKEEGPHLVLPPWSDIVMPYPFVRDDKDETLRKIRTPAARRMPAREQQLEANAGQCEFEISLDVQEIEWTVGAWRNLMSRKLAETKRLHPSNIDTDAANKNDDNKDSTTAESTSEVHHHMVGSSAASMPGAPSRSKKPVPDQALVMTLVGSIESRNCDFSATLNATAIRTDWEATTNKAINYSFYMMLVCLTQIIILLRQLLHSQAQAAATRVSIVCIGWQTVVDALICLGHIYLSLAMQPLFTAFASVAFFKLLIFCVIEMKYMAIIIQARNSANGGQPTEVLRRQVAVLHLRIYVALFGTFLLLFYVGDSHRTLSMVALYSFWLPQIILNIVTEARTPLHKYYIYGMSVTRMVAPLYVFCIRKNFLKEVYPDAPYDPYMCQVLLLWVAFQTAVLMAQSKYGARFMIPARFLPPKFDYSRPLPLSMLPPGTTAASMEMPTPDSDESETSPPRERRRRHNTTADTTRNRMKKGNRSKVILSDKTETISDNRATSPVQQSRLRPPPTLDCSICYEGIDIRDREGYMLAPCEHLYHRDCLVRWMDVKMECPICRTELPAL